MFLQKNLVYKGLNIMMIPEKINSYYGITKYM